MILRIHHVQITIPAGAEEQGRHFYCEVLGLPEIVKPAILRERGGFWLQADDRQVHVGVEETGDRTTTKAHLAYEVADLAAWRERLTSAGVEILEGIPIPGYERFELRDPFGNRVELIQPVTAASQTTSMVTFDRGVTRFTYRVAGIIIENGSVLLQYSGSGLGSWLPPGGRAELLETSEESLRREMREELGEEVQVTRLLWFTETFFTLDNVNFHEIGMYYLVQLPTTSALRDPTFVHHFEDAGMQLHCAWHDLGRLNEIVLYPAFLREAIHKLPDSPQHIVMRELG